MKLPDRRAKAVRDIRRCLAAGAVDDAACSVAGPTTEGRRGAKSTSLRSYPTDSSAAAARIVALAMIADGRLTADEFDVVTQGDCSKLGIERTHLRDALSELCEDLLAEALSRGSDACCVGPNTIRRVADEIGDRGLRFGLTSLCLRIAAADRHVSRGEAQFLLQVFEHWNADDEEVASALFGIGSAPQIQARV